MKIKGVIFDLDGTLVDTLDDLTDSMNAALTQIGRPARCSRDCMQMIGHGLRTFAERALGDAHLHLTESLLERMVAYYQEHCLLRTAPYTGIAETVTILAANGVRLGVLTNKNQRPAELITRHFFGEAFGPIVGAADGRPAKPDPQTTLEMVAGWGLQAGEVVFVGDSETDIRTAANAGIRCIACQWGFRSKGELLEAGADVLAEQPGQLLEILGEK